MSAGAPNSHMMPTALTIAVTAPASSASRIGSARRQISARRAQIGTASPTTAGPSRKLSG